MTEAIVVKQSTEITVESLNSKKDLIKRTIAKGATDDELQLFILMAARKGLDPFGNEIYFTKHRNKDGSEKMTVITGIGGYRKIADRTGKYAGNDEPVFDKEDPRPSKATVTVWKLVGGVRCPFTATARWKEYYPGDTKGFKWNQSPCLMLGKCAEALALRKAFPDEMSGLYVKEEMDQVERIVEIKQVQSAKPTYDKENNEHKKV